MARVSTYLNFPRSTEEAFSFYKSVFGAEFTRRSRASATSRTNPGSLRCPRPTRTWSCTLSCPFWAATCSWAPTPPSRWALR